MRATMCNCHYQHRRVMQAKFQSCCKTLNAYCRNVYKDMADDAKRRIKLDNKALQERIAPLPGGLDFLAQVGFQVHWLRTAEGRCGVKQHASHACQ